MAYYRDFREFLVALEGAGKLRRIQDPIDKDRELHPLVKWQYRGIDEPDRFGFLFEHVTDRRGQRLPGRVASSVIAANREIYALALGCPLEEVHRRWTAALEHPIPTSRVATGPVKEEIHQGESLLAHNGLQEFGIPVATNGWEAFPRITAAAVISKDPESGVYNAGMYNSIVLGPARANIRTSRHLRSHWDKARRRGEPLQAAIVIGALPVVAIAAATDVPHGVYELEVAGALAGEPIEVVPCETVDLEVPATAEVVIEGRVPIDFMDRDGPSGENRGYVMYGQRVLPFEVTAITHRQDPIWHDVICQLPPSESSVMRSVNCEGRVMALFHAHGIPHVKDVAFHHSGSARHLCVVRLQEIGGARPPNSEVWHALYTVMSVASSWPKIIIAVDEDIDPWDLESVMWAVINRHQSHRDVKIIQGRTGGLDDSVAPPGARGDRGLADAAPVGGDASVMLVDATRKWAYPPVSLPRRDYMEHAQGLWERLELPRLRPREPWHGVSLGYWPEDAARLVDLAEQDRVEEAAQLLLTQGLKLEAQ